MRDANPEAPQPTRPIAESNVQIVAWEDTRLGLLCLRKRVMRERPDLVVMEITINDEFLMSSYLTESERTLASHAIQLHPGQDLTVLIGGLGLGYTAHAALADARVAEVEVIEFLPEVIAWTEREMIPLAAELKADARLRIVEDDVYARLMGPASTQYDLILIDVDHSPADPLSLEGNDVFYTEEGLAKVKPHLAAGGLLALWSYAEHSNFEAALRRVFAEVTVVPVTVMNDLIGEEQTDWLFFARD